MIVFYQNKKKIHCLWLLISVTTHWMSAWKIGEAAGLRERFPKAYIYNRSYVLMVLAVSLCMYDQKNRLASQASI